MQMQLQNPIYRMNNTNEILGQTTILFTAKLNVRN